MEPPDVQACVIQYKIRNTSIIFFFEISNVKKTLYYKIWLKLLQNLNWNDTV